MRVIARLVCWGAALSMLAGCNPFTEPPTGEYAHVLERGETVVKAEPYGRFTALSVEYRQGGGSLMSTHNESMRLIHDEKVVVRNTDAIERWTDFAAPVYFTRLGDEYKLLALVHERAGKAVVVRISAAVNGYEGTEPYPHGFPLSPGIRYFPVSQLPGFLVSAMPVTVTPLPKASNGGDSLQLHALAAVSPNGRSFAYVDSEYAPSVVMVVDADGRRREPLPLPRFYLADEPVYVGNPYARLWDWSRGALSWYKNAAGSWDVQPEGMVPVQADAGRAVEQLFISDQTGYRSCFAATHRACLPGWCAANPAELRGAHVEGDEAPPFVYAPQQAVTAFGGQVRVLQFSGHCCAVPSYHLYLDGAPEAVVAQLSARLRQAKTPFVRVDQCPRRSGNDDKCAAQLAQQLGRPKSQGRALENMLDSVEEQQGVLFVMPTLAVMVRANGQGGSTIQTVMRADFSRTD